MVIVRWEHFNKNNYWRNWIVLKNLKKKLYNVLQKVYPKLDGKYFTNRNYKLINAIKHLYEYLKQEVDFNIRIK